MPRPEPRWITFSIDGREVRAPENAMLVDAAAYGDVEIPVFCYEPKLGQPVGACRMCLVEIEGIPKLQTGCSTAVKDGMVVHTQSDRVKSAQRAVVEFLLINHPLDCPVCDKGGECPLQDITFGWGGGVSRFIEPKRHFEKPLELSPLIAIDRERCILCYRCVRFSQEISEDYQLILQERGAHSYVATFDGHPYVAPFSGNIIELCPVGALTSRPYRFRARPWDIEDAGTICTLCPSQCNILLTVRDERLMRVLARQNDEVDDGWLCDKGRFAYQAVHSDARVTEPMVRDGGELRAVDWERALQAAASGLRRARGRVAALAGGGTTGEEAFLLQRLLREGMDSGDVDCRVGPPLPLELHQALAAPALAATVSDLEWARAVLVLDCEPVDEAPILELRLRKGHRRHRVALAIAGARPSALDADAALTLRYEPGGGPAFVAALRAALRGGPADGPLAELVALLRGREGEANAGEVVILWSERLARGPHGPGALADLHAVAGLLGLAETAGAGLLEVPSSPNGRGLREAGMLPGIGPGYAAARPGRDAAEIARATAAGEITALYLLGTDPLDSHPDHEGWERALEKASTIVAHAEFLTEGLREHATVVFPAQSYAEKEGTVVHPDGRLQRLRPGIANPGTVRPEWYVLADVADRVGHSLGILTGAAATAQLIDAVPFYHGLSLEEIGGRGVRWPERDSAARLPAATPTPGGGGAGAERPAPEGALRLGTYRPVWASAAVQASPALAFLHPLARVELSPADAAERGLEHGQQVQVRDLADETRALLAIVELRHAVPAGSAFLPEGIPGAPATRFTGADGAVFVQVEIPPEPEPELEGELDESGMPIVVGGEDFEPPEASPEPELP